jgi:hypothetical protein
MISQRAAHPSPRARQRANRCSVAYGNQPSQTLCFNREFTAVQAVIPVAGADQRQSVRPKLQALIQRACAVFEE